MVYQEIVTVVFHMYHLFCPQMKDICSPLPHYQTIPHSFPHTNMSIEMESIIATIQLVVLPLCCHIYSLYNIFSISYFPWNILQSQKIANTKVTNWNSTLATHYILCVRATFHTPNYIRIIFWYSRVSSTKISVIKLLKYPCLRLLRIQFRVLPRLRILFLLSSSSSSKISIMRTEDTAIATLFSILYITADDRPQLQLKRLHKVANKCWLVCGDGQHL